MIVKSLKLKNYRNYEYLNMEFGSETNILYGDNAQGKTNILEALYMSGTTKSHRGTKEKDIIRFGKEESHIETRVEKRGIPFQIDMHLKKNAAKGIAVNKIPLKKAGELFGIIHFVLFSPEDLNIIKEGPAGRRRFLDLELSQLDKVYLNNLSNYNKTLNQRNALLKEIAYQEKGQELLGILDLQLIQYGNKIMDSRRKFVDKINKIISDISDFIFISDRPQKVDAIFLPGGSHPEQPESAAEMYHNGLSKWLIPAGGISVKIINGPAVQRPTYITKTIKMTVNSLQMCC